MTNSKNLNEAVEIFQRAEEAIKEVTDELVALAISTKDSSTATPYTALVSKNIMWFSFAHCCPLDDGTWRCAS